MSSERLFGWWVLAESVARHLTSPVDVAASDARIERVLTESSLFAAGRSMVAKIERASADSRAARGLRAIVGDLARLSSVDRLRAGAIVSIIGSLVALALQALQPMRTTWFDLMLPAAVAVAAALVYAGAPPLAHALAARRQ